MLGAERDGLARLAGTPLRGGPSAEGTDRHCSMGLGPRCSARPAGTVQPGRHTPGTPPGGQGCCWPGVVLWDGSWWCGGLRVLPRSRLGTGTTFLRPALAPPGQTPQPTAFLPPSWKLVISAAPHFSPISYPGHGAVTGRGAAVLPAPRDPASLPEHAAQSQGCDVAEFLLRVLAPAGADGTQRHSRMPLVQ